MLFRLVDDPQDKMKPYEEYAAHIAIVFLVVYLVFCLFTLVLLVFTKEQRKSPVNMMATNIMFSHLMVGLFCHPGSIHVDLLYKSVPLEYCWFWHYGTWIYMCFVTYSLVAYSIERFLYVQNPTLHKQRFTKLATAALLLLPWLLSVVFTIIAHHGFAHEVIVTQNGTENWNANLTINVCKMFSTSDYLTDERGNLTTFILVSIPVVCFLIFAIVTLTIWCCYKEHATIGAHYLELGDEVRQIVRDSVIAVVLLNLIGVVVILANLITYFILPMKTALLSLFGVIQGVVWLFSIKDTRDKLSDIIVTCFRLKNSNSGGAAHYCTGEEDNVNLKTEI